MIIEISRTKFVTIILFMVSMTSLIHIDNNNVISTVAAEVQKLTPVYSESRCFVLEIPKGDDDNEN